MGLRTRKYQHFVASQNPGQELAERDRRGVVQKVCLFSLWTAKCDKKRPTQGVIISSVEQKLRDKWPDAGHGKDVAEKDGAVFRSLSTRARGGRPRWCDSRHYLPGVDRPVREYSTRRASCPGGDMLHDMPRDPRRGGGTSNKFAIKETALCTNAICVDCDYKGFFLYGAEH